MFSFSAQQVDQGFGVVDLNTEGTASLSLEKHHVVLTSLLASFPRVVPTKVLLTKAMLQLNNELLFLREDDYQVAKAEAEKLRAMLAYVRRNVRRNGRGARHVTFLVLRAELVRMCELNISVISCPLREGPLLWRC